MVEKVYRFNWVARLFFFSFIPACYLLYILTMAYGYHWKPLFFKWFGIPVGIYNFIYSLRVRIIINDKGIEWRSGVLEKTKQFDWDEIDFVIDERKLFFARWYDVLPKDSAREGLMYWIRISTSYVNYRDLLKEIALHAKPHTRIFPGVLKAAGLPPK